MIERSAGILLPIFSLPSNYGIGTLGKKAYEFVDFLQASKQSYWQILPIGQTSYGDSPYQSFSSYAGNPYFIDLDLLIEDGLLTKEDVKDLKNEKYIDYSNLYETRYYVLFKAFRRGLSKYKEEFTSFCNDNEKWLNDYCLYMAVKRNFNMASWQDWPDQAIKFHEEKAIDGYNKLLADDIEYYKFIQFLFFKQYKELKKYANEKGIKIIGDLPIYVALDSADVWSNYKDFKLDARRRPTEVAGVPPDYFSEDGQLWGNPLYDWDYMKSNGYKWWIERVDQTSKLFDVIRIDHFRGFADYWSIPVKEKTAKNGKWNKGPGIDFVRVIRDWFSNVEFIAEDLGVASPSLKELLKESGFPGMRVLVFGLTLEDDTHLPHHHTKNSVCYIGTHDNKPIMGFWKDAKKKEKDFATRYFKLEKDERINKGFIRGAMGSCSNLCIIQLQDYLGLGSEATINQPGTLDNWKYRLDDGALTKELSKEIKDITEFYQRDKREDDK